MSEPASPRAFEVVVHWVEDLILTGELRVGDLLPSERDLAQQLQVGRSAVREAVRTLQAQGVLRSSVGAGSAGGTRLTAMPSGALTRLLRMHVALANFPLTDVLEVRVALEKLSARLASERAGLTSADATEALAPVRDALQRMRQATDRSAFNDADTEFHVAIAEAAGNRLAADTTIAIRESVRQPLMETFEALTEHDYQQLLTRLHVEHEEILAAITAGEGKRAEDLIEAHVRGAWAALQTGAGAGAVPVTATMGV